MNVLTLILLMPFEFLVIVWVRVGQCSDLQTQWWILERLRCLRRSSWITSLPWEKVHTGSLTFFFRPSNTNTTHLLLISLAHIVVMNRKHYFMTSLYSLYNQFPIG